MSAGSGIRHAEVADPASGPTRFVQAWVRPDSPGGSPEHHELAVDLDGSGLVPVAGSGGLPIRTTGASLQVARLAPGDTVALPDAPLVHAFAATGALDLGDGAGGRRLTGRRTGHRPAVRGRRLAPLRRARAGGHRDRAHRPAGLDLRAERRAAPGQAMTVSAPGSTAATAGGAGERREDAERLAVTADGHRRPGVGGQLDARRR